MKRIRKDDDVVVTTGKYKGKRGRVLKIVSEGQRVLVEGINMIKRHVKPNPQKNQQGGIVEKEASVHISNVSLFDPVEKKPSRIGFKVKQDGKKVRVYKSSGEEVSTL